MGHALYLYHSKLLFAGNVRFTTNIGYAGSAMYIYDTDVQYSDCNITFQYNGALYTGGRDSKLVGSTLFVLLPMNLKSYLMDPILGASFSMKIVHCMVVEMLYMEVT